MNTLQHPHSRTKLRTCHQTDATGRQQARASAHTSARQGFTLLEIMLAASLASLVVLGCLAGFFAVERTDQALAARFEQANDMARLQKVMQRTFSTLIVTPQAPDEETLASQATGSDQAAQTENTAPTNSPTATDADGQIQAVDLSAEQALRPRLLLEQDSDPMLSSLVSKASYKAGGGGSSIASPQRLEVVLSSVPILPPSVQSSAWSNALAGVEDASSDEEAPQYSGVRGAFVLRPDDTDSIHSRRRASHNDTRLGWTLWWQPLDGRSEPARIASGLSQCHFRAYFERQMHDDLATYTADQLPSYVELEVKTLSGIYASYLFEIVWTVDELADQNADASQSNQTADGGGADTQITGNGNGNVRSNNNGQGNGQGNGQNQRRRGRPKPNTLQGTRPGRQLDGRPQRSQPPGTGQRPQSGPGRNGGQGRNGGPGGAP